MLSANLFAAYVMFTAMSLAFSDVMLHIYSYSRSKVLTSFVSVKFSGRWHYRLHGMISRDMSLSDTRPYCCAI